MDRIRFSVRGSKGDIYDVTFEESDGRVHAFCTCKAGQYGLYCRHRIRLMNGEYDRIAGENTEDLCRLREMLRGSDLESKYRAVTEAEKLYVSAKKVLDEAKGEFARAMYR